MKKLFYTLLIVNLFCVLYISSFSAHQVDSSFGYATALYLNNQRTTPLTNENARVWASTRNVVAKDINALLPKNKSRFNTKQTVDAIAWDQGCKLEVLECGDAQVVSLTRTLAGEFIRQRYMIELSKMVDTNTVIIAGQIQGGGNGDILTPHGNFATWIALASSIFMLCLVPRYFKATNKGATRGQP